MRILDLVLYIDGDPSLEFTLDLICVLAAGALAILPLWQKRDGRRRPWWQNPLLFIVFLGLSLFACRVPMLLCPLNLNPDEAQLVAQAVTYQTYPVPWRDVDGGTAGPLDSYSVLWCVPFGLQPSYYSARTAGVFCVLGMMTFLYLAGRRIAGEVPARISILPTFVFLCFTTSTDYLHYSTEQLSLLLIGLAIYLLERLKRRTESIGLVVVLGITVGLLPWAKLQSALPGAVLELIAVAFLLLGRRGPLGVALARCGILALATIVPGAVLLSTVAAAGAFGDFWNSYIMVGRTYGPHYPTVGADLAHKTYLASGMFTPGWPMTMPTYLMMGLGGIVGACLLTKQIKASRAARDWCLVGLLLVVTTVATIVASNMPFPHYHFYLLPALGLMTLANFRILRTWMRKAPTRRLAVAMASFLVLSGLTLYVVIYWSELHRVKPSMLKFCYSGAPLMTLVGIFALRAAIRPNPSGVARQRSAAVACFVSFFVVPLMLMGFPPNPLQGDIQAFTDHPFSPMDEAILRVRPPGGRLAILGWAPEYAAETGTPLGTRDAISQCIFNPGPLRTYYRERYLRDMQTNRPELFLEATLPAGRGFENLKFAEIDDFPELAKYVVDQYRFDVKIDGMRLFVRKDLSVPIAKSNPGQ